MKLERPKYRVWPRVLLSIDVFFGVVVLFLCNRVDENLVWIGNIILWTVLAAALTAMIISDRDDILFSEAGEKSQEAVRAAERKASALEAEKIHLEHQVESVAVELQHLKEKYKSLQEEDQDLQRENASLQRENIALILNSAQRIAELNSRITELKLKKGAPQ